MQCCCQPTHLQVGQALQQIQGDVTLEMPNVEVTDAAVSAKDPDVVQLLEGYLSDWSNQIAAILEREGDKLPSGKGPLSEIEFWRGRLGLFSSVFEQLNTPQGQKYLEVLRTGSTDRNLLTNFNAHYSELSKLTVEARDNVKFLATLERHFKSISRCGCWQFGMMAAAQPMAFLIPSCIYDMSRAAIISNATCALSWLLAALSE